VGGLRCHIAGALWRLRKLDDVLTFMLVAGFVGRDTTLQYVAYPWCRQATSDVVLTWGTCNVPPLEPTLFLPWWQRISVSSEGERSIASSWCEIR
jgi:hypothetical protein